MLKKHVLKVNMDKTMLKIYQFFVKAIKAADLQNLIKNH